MGVVYRAIQVRLKRVVALKMVSAGGYASPEVLARFLAEAESIARLRHPNVVQVYDRGECEGLPFYSMEYFAAGSLGQRIDGTPWAAFAAARVVEQVSRGVAEAHRLGIVHRDLKPANILLGDDGTPKVADFGLAKSLDSTSDLTRTDRVLGTPSYMAPEQAEGKAGLIGPAADIYSLGAIFYELITGRPPFKAATALETLVQVRTADPVAPSRLVPGLARDAETIALKSLHKDPSRRYATARELADDLRRFAAGEMIVARRAGPLERGWHWARRHRTVAALTVALVLTLAGGLAGVSWKWRDAVAAGRKAIAAESRTAEQLAIAKRAREEADEARAGVVQSRDRLRSQAADLALERGLSLAERGEVAKGLHWMLEGLRLAPEEANDLRRVARVNLATWSRRLHAPRRVYVGGSAEVRSIALDPDGRRLFAADKRGIVRFWDTATGAGVGPGLSHPGLVRALAVSPDGRSLVAVGAEKVTRIWRLEGEPTSTSLPHPAPVVFAAFAPDGRTLLTGCEDGVARIWDVASVSLVKEFVRGEVTRGGFVGPDGQWRLVQVRGPVASIRDGAGGRHGNDLLHWGDITALAIKDGGESIVTSTSDRMNRIWRSSDLHLIEEFTATAVSESMAFTPDGRILVAGDTRGTTLLRDASSGRSLGEPMIQPAGVKSYALGRDGLVLFVGLGDGTIWQWDLAPELMIPRDEAETLADGVESLSPDARRPEFDQAIYRPDDPVAVIVGYPNHSGRLWDMRSQRSVALRCGTKGGVQAVTFSADGRRVATGGVNNVARVWDAETGRPITEPLRHMNYVRAVAFSPDGSTLATGGYDHLVHFWDAFDRTAKAGAAAARRYRLRAGIRTGRPFPRRRDLPIHAERAERPDLGSRDEEADRTGAHHPWDRRELFDSWAEGVGCGPRRTMRPGSGTRRQGGRSGRPSPSASRAWPGRSPAMDRRS